MKNILTILRDIKGVISGDDSMALGAYAAFKEAGKDNAIVVGFAGGSDVLKSIRERGIKATVSVNIRKLAHMAVEKADQFIRMGIPKKRRLQSTGGR